MATPEEEALEKRRKKTVWLMAIGATSLLIPLAGAFYLHWRQNAGAAGPSGRSDVFERREGEDRKITPTQTAVVSPSGMNGALGKQSGSSLDFIKGNADLHAQGDDSKAAVVPPASTETVTPEEAPAQVAAAKTGGKPGKKPFTMAKLKLSHGFSSFGSSGSKDKANAAQGTTKNLPPGAANDPGYQEYLKTHPRQ